MPAGYRKPGHPATAGGPAGAGGAALRASLRVWATKAALHARNALQWAISTAARARASAHLANNCASTRGATMKDGMRPRARAVDLVGDAGRVLALERPRPAILRRSSRASARRSRAAESAPVDRVRVGGAQLDGSNDPGRAQGIAALRGGEAGDPGALPRGRARRPRRRRHDQRADLATTQARARFCSPRENVVHRGLHQGPKKGISKRISALHRPLLSDPPPPEMTIFCSPGRGVLVAHFTREARAALAPPLDGRGPAAAVRRSPWRRRQSSK